MLNASYGVGKTKNRRILAHHEFRSIISDKFIEQYSDAAADIKHNHYVDDYLVSVDTVKEAINLALKFKYIHANAGFNIRNWINNNIEVLAAINGNDSPQNKSLDLGNEIEADKVLGIFRKSSDDNIALDGKKIPSKREIQKFLMS